VADLSAFDAGFGETSGAVTPAGGGIVDGAKALLLGDDEHRTLTVADGDFDEVVQLATLPAATRLVRARLLARTRATEIGTAWTLTVRKGGAARVSLPLWAKPWARELVDVTVPVAIGGEDVEVGFRLGLFVMAGGDAAVTLPAVVVDAVVEDEHPSGSRPLLINRNPEPGETGVPVGAPVVVEIHDPYDTAIATALSASVSVGGAVAWSLAGGFAAGFSGSVDVLDAGATWRVSIQPDTPFDSLEHVPVTVAYEGTDPLVQLSAAYAFQAEDVTAPKILRGDAIGHDVIRVTFDEPVLRADGSGSVGGDALAAQHWTVSLASTSLDDGLPAVDVAVQSVAAAPASFGTAVDLRVDDAMTAGARYLVTAVGVEDAFGNVVDPDYDSVIVLGYGCPRPDGRRFELADWVPPLNVAEDKSRSGGTRELELLLKVWQHVFDRILCDIDRWTDIIDPDLAPEAFVDAMLADFGVSNVGPRRTPFGFFGLDTDQKRRLIRAVVSLYKQKGTGDGIAAAVLLFLGVDVTVSTPALDGVWVLGQAYLGLSTKLGTGEQALLYSFYITSTVDLTDAERYWITAFAEYAKPAHCHFLGILEPSSPADVQHWQLNLSALGVQTFLHDPTP
jgi:phage tail-like protein